MKIPVRKRKKSCVSKFTIGIQFKLIKDLFFTNFKYGLTFFHISVLTIFSLEVVMLIILFFINSSILNQFMYSLSFIPHYLRFSGY